MRARQSSTALLSLVGVAGLALPLGACGSPAVQSGSGPTTYVGAGPTTVTTPAGPTTIPAPQYETIGGLNVTFPHEWGGGSGTITYALGQPVVADAPPAGATDLVSACDMNGTVGSVWIPGQISITFHGGPDAEEIPVYGGDITGWAGPVTGGADLSDGVLEQAVESGGQWSCGMDSGTNTGQLVSGSTGFQFDLNPGQTVTLPMWVIGVSVVNNNAPTFSAAANRNWVFYGGTFGNLGDATETSTLSYVSSAFGPHAAQCSTDGMTTQPLVSLFASPPFSFTNPGPGSSFNCTKIRR